MSEIPQKERFGPRIGLLVPDDETGQLKTYPWLGTASGAGRVADEISGVARYPVVPQVNGVDCSQVRIVHDSGTAVDTRFMAGAADTVDAANGLIAKSEGVVSVMREENHRIVVPFDGSAGNITSVYMLARNMYGTHAGHIIIDSHIDNFSVPANTELAKVMHISATVAEVLGPTSTPADWANATAYVVGDYVLNDGVVYVCINNHTSAAATDEPGAGSGWASEWMVMPECMVHLQFDDAKQVREFVISSSEFLDGSKRIQVLNFEGRSHAE